MSRLVIYHGPLCQDGFCAAWLFHRAFPDSRFVPANYGDELTLPQPGDNEVFLLDFTYKRPQMEILAADCARNGRALTVIDHHESAAREFYGFIPWCKETLNFEPRIIFEIGKSGGRLTWEYLKLIGQIRDETEPNWIVQYTEDRDLWRWKLPNSREIDASLRSYLKNFDTWDFLRNINPISFIHDGDGILRMEQRLIEQHVAMAREIEIAGHKVLCVNATVQQSEIAGALAQGRPFGACYMDDGHTRRWSLRSRHGGINVALVAESLGGGGHEKAASFEERLPDSEVLIP